jgi:hypothetical protein
LIVHRPIFAFYEYMCIELSGGSGLLCYEDMT